MTKLSLRLDMRAPAFANTPQDLYRIGIEMAAWADAHGFAECMLSEHHGSDDGYLPSPLVFGGAIAARTQRIRIRVSALVLPLHETNSYASWYAELGTAGPYQPLEDADSLRQSGLYQVLTPSQCIELVQDLGDNGLLFFQPLLGGLHPDVGWQSLQLLAGKVLPEL